MENCLVTLCRKAGNGRNIDHNLLSTIEKDNYNLILGNKFEQLEREYLEEVIPIEELNKKITNIITNTSEQLAKGGTKNNHQTKISQNTMKLIQKRNNMLHVSKTWTSRQRIEYSELNKNINKKTRTEVKSQKFQY